MIEIENICVSFRKENQKKIFGIERQQVLYHVNMQVDKGECLGIIGESGSGKSTLGRTLCGLLKPNKGIVKLDNQELYNPKVKRNTKETLISVVFQDYTTSANPRFTVRQIIGESFIVREKKEGIKLDKEKELSEILELVGLSMDYANRYPHELSGGQLQRVCIARAVAVKPKIILFDEAISSLDSHTQVQIMDLLEAIKNKYKLTYLFITHDLSSVTYLCDRVLFLYQGRVVEECLTKDIGQVQHAYAKKLINSIIELKMNS